MYLDDSAQVYAFLGCLAALLAVTCAVGVAAMRRR